MPLQELVLCGEKGKCTNAKKRNLLQELADVKGQVTELEKEALYDGKEADIMTRTANLRATQASTTPHVDRREARTV